jgi:hypothetical protein
MEGDFPDARVDCSIHVEREEAGTGEFAVLRQLPSGDVRIITIFHLFVCHCDSRVSPLYADIVTDHQEKVEMQPRIYGPVEPQARFRRSYGRPSEPCFLVCLQLPP